MASSVQLHLDIENSLAQTLKQTQVLMGQFNTSLEKSGKLTRTVDDHFDDIEQSAKETTKYTKAWNTALQKTKDLAKSLAAPILGIFSTAKILDTVKAVMSHNTQMRNLSFRMGEAGKTTGQLTSAMHDIAMATGTSTENTAKLVQNLRQLRVPTRDIAELGKRVQMFIEITGMAGDAATQMTGNLIRMGGVGVKGAKDIMNVMAGVQRQVGLAEHEMNLLADASVKATQMLAQFGKSEQDIIRFNKGMARMAGAFVSVGARAEDALDVIDRLLDPGRIEENALLYAKLGVSMEDALSGNLDPNVLTQSFKNLGRELKDMSGPAAAAMAQALGMPLRQLRQMADMETDIAKGGKDVQKMFEEQASPQQRLQRTMERLSTIFEKLATGPVLKIAELLATGVEKLMKFASGIFGGGGKKGMMIIGIVAAIAGIFMLIKKVRSRLFGMNAEVSKDLGKATEQALIMAHTKARTVAAQASTRAGRGARATAQERIQVGPGYAAQLARADQMAIATERQMLPAVKKMAEHTENWVRDIAMGSRGMSRMTIFTEQNNKKIREKLNLTRQEGILVTEGLNAKIDEIGKNKEIYQQRIKVLEGMDRNTEQEWELKKLRIDELKMGIQIEKIGKDRNKEQEYYNKLKTSLIRNLSPEERFNMKENLKKQAELNKETLETTRSKIKDLNTQEQILKMQKKIVGGAQEKLEREVKAGRASTQQVDEYTKLTRQLKEINELQKDNTSELKEQRQLTERITDEQKRSAKEMGELGKVEGGALKQSFWRRVLRMGQSAGNRVAAGFKDAGKVLRNSAKVFGKVMVEKLDPRNWGRALKTRLQEAGGGSAIKGSLKKLLGPIGILAGVLLASKPIQEAIKKIMTAIKPIIELIGKLLAPVIDAFMPLIQEIAKALMPILVKVLGGAVWILGILVRAIGNLITTLVDFGISVQNLFMKQSTRQEKISETLSKLTPEQFRKVTGVKEGVSVEQYVTRLSKAASKQIYKKIAQAASGVYGFGMKMAETGAGLIKTGEEMWKGTYEQEGAGAGVGATGAEGATIIEAIKGQARVTGKMTGVKTPAEGTEENTDNTSKNTEEIKDTNAAIFETLTKLLGEKTFADALKEEKERIERLPTIRNIRTIEKALETHNIEDVMKVDF